MERVVFDNKIFEELFRLHFINLMGFVCSYVKDEEVAKDIVHDVFFSLWRNRKHLDSSYSMKSYLFTLSRNYALNYLKHLRVVASNEREVGVLLESANDELEQHEKRLFCLREKLAQLSGKQQEVLNKYFVDGLGYKEIAEELGISLNTVKTHLARALKFLREEMREEVILLFLISKNSDYFKNDCFGKDIYLNRETNEKKCRRKYTIFPGNTLRFIYLFVLSTGLIRG